MRWPGSLRLRSGVLVELGLLAAVLTAEGFLFAEGLRLAADYDEGSYLAAVDALRHGQTLGSEVFTPQPPGFYLLLAAGDLVLPESVTAMRVTILVFALAASVAAFLVGRTIGGRWAGLLAAALLGVASPFTPYATRISADLPALALALLALLAFLHALRPGPRQAAAAVAGGALFAAAASVKLSALTLLVPLACYAALRRPGRRVLVAAGGGLAAVLIPLLAAHADALGGIWEGNVTYHADARNTPVPGLRDNARALVDYFDPRTRNAVVWLAPLGLAAWLVLRPRLRLPLWPLWAWAAALALSLVWHRPVHANHYVLLAGTLALAAAIGLAAGIASLPPRQALIAASALVFALGAGYAHELREFEHNYGPETVDVRVAAGVLRAGTAADDLVVSDRPVIAYLARRRMPGSLVDTAALRFWSGSLTPAEVLREVDEHDVRAVVVAREFRKSGRGVLPGLQRRFPIRVRRGDIELYFRDDR